MRTTLIFGVCLALGGCKKPPQKFNTTLQVERAQAFGATEQAPSILDIEFTYPDCPGKPEGLVRGDKAFGACAKSMKAGDKVPAEITFSYNADRQQYRSDITKVGDCERKPDPKDDATFELIHDCKDVMIHGVSMGVRCDKTRSAELVGKCPWFKRN